MTPGDAPPSAQRIGPPACRALGGRARGRVVGASPRAALARLDHGVVVALLPAGAPIHPWAVSAPVDLSAVPLGAEVRTGDGALQVGPWRIGLAAAQVIDLRLRTRPAALAAAAAATAAAALARLTRAHAGDSDLGPADAALRSALRRFRHDGRPEHLLALVGLGPGLTPSGDDMLIGFLAGLDLASAALPAAAGRHADLASACKARAPALTGALSAQLLTAAADGLYAEPLLGLLSALASLATPEAPAVLAALADAVGPVLAMGHHSGADTVRGLAAALESLPSGNRAHVDV